MGRSGSVRLAAAVACGLAAVALPAAAQEEVPDDQAPGTGRVVEEWPESFVWPVMVEGGPSILVGRFPIPYSRVYAAVGVPISLRSIGRADYEETGVRMMLGGAWSPRGLRELEIGGEMAVLVAGRMHTSVPPLIDETSAEFDAGEARVHAAYLAYRWKSADRTMDFTVTPHLQLTLPTDTTRWNDGRRRPAIRRVLDDAVMDDPFVLTDVGVTHAFRWRMLSFYKTLGFVFAAIGDDFEFLYAAATGLAANLWRFELVLEMDLVWRPTHVTSAYLATAASPAVRYRIDDEWAVGLEGRFALDEDAHAAFGEYTVGLSARYDFDRP